MNNYETVFIATPVLSDVQFKELVSKFQGIITENGGQIIHSEDWGLRKLAYPIQKKTTGFYHLIQFEGDGELIDKIETQYRRDEKVIRFLSFRMDKHAVEYAIKRISKNKELKAEAAIAAAAEPTEGAEAVETVEAIEPAVVKEVKKPVAKKVVEPTETVVEPTETVVEPTETAKEEVIIETNDNKEE